MSIMGVIRGKTNSPYFLSISPYSSPFLTNGWRATYKQAPNVVSVIERVAAFVDSKTFAASGAS